MEFTYEEKKILKDLVEVAIENNSWDQAFGFGSGTTVEEYEILLEKVKNL